MPIMAISAMATIACIQLAARPRMPGTSRNSAVPIAAASTPLTKAPPQAQRPARSQNGSADHQ